MIRVLPQSGADPVRSDWNGGRTLFYLLAGRPDVDADIVRRVLRAGVPANARIIGRSVITRAAAHARNPEVIRALIDAGADPNAPDWIDSRTPLMTASTCNPNPLVTGALVEAAAAAASSSG